MTPEQQAQCCALYLWKGWTAGQLGGRYGVHERTIRTLLARTGCRKREHVDAVWTRRVVQRARLALAPDLSTLGDAPGLEAASLPEAPHRRIGRPRDSERAAPPRAVNDGEAWTPHGFQTPPEGDWRTWLFLGGRGAGKTRAGAEWVAALCEGRAGAQAALVGPGLHEVREVMIEGPSGIRRLPGRERPRWEASRRRLVWANGSAAYAYSAEDPESLRGPQHDAAWADEFCVWRGASATLALLRFGLRLGASPRLAVTTTPKPIPPLRALMAEPGCVISRASTRANAAWLAPAFVESLEGLYGGTRLAAQELEGEVLSAPEGALWTKAMLAGCLGPAPERFDRVVVGVDPPASRDGAECGIVVAGRVGERAWVLADRTVGGVTPDGWARRVVAAAAEFRAQAIVAEANQGGDMVKSVLSVAGPPCPVKLVHAHVGKRARAEPVAALYEQGRVTHAGVFAALEEQLGGIGADGFEGGPSPDRADALVWALTELLVKPAGALAGPRVRWLDW